MEIVRQNDAQEDPATAFRYRDRDKREADLVLERRAGTIIAIEVRAAASVKLSDSRGLRFLRDRLEDRFFGGALRYTGAETVSFGGRLAPLPLSGSTRCSTRRTRPSVG